MVNTLQEATERICELEGSLVALDALCSAMLQQLPHASRDGMAAAFESCAEAARTSMLNASISEHAIAAFEFNIARSLALIRAIAPPDAPPMHGVPPMPEAPTGPETTPPIERPVVETLLLAVPRVSTFDGERALTGASGFFFERDERLYLVTSRHVLVDGPSQHYPDRVEIEVHTDELDLSHTAVFSLLLHEDGQAVWHQAEDSGGEIDVAALRIDREMLGGFRPRAFTPEHLEMGSGEVEVGTPLLVVGFPLGFHDSRYHLPVARQAAVASSFGTRFQGQGLFLTDARTHRGSSGAPVVMRMPGDERALPWKLLGIHSARMDMGGRDLVEDESLGLNCAWYADILLTLTES